MQALGYGSQPYIVFKHHDIEREHIHIVSLRVNEQGEKINDGFEKRRSKRITDALEQKYGLIPSTPTKEQVLQKASTEKPLNESVENRKTKVEKVLRAVLAHYKFASLGELNAILTHYHLTVEEVKTEVRGKRYDGLVYLLTDDEGKKESMPIAASELGRGLGYTAITNHIKRSKFALKTDIPKVRQRVLMTMYTSPSSEIDLKKSLINKVCVSFFGRIRQGAPMHHLYRRQRRDSPQWFTFGQGIFYQRLCPISARHRSKSFLG